MGSLVGMVNFLFFARLPFTPSAVLVAAVGRAAVLGSALLLVLLYDLLVDDEGCVVVKRWRPPLE